MTFTVRHTLSAITLMTIAAIATLPAQDITSKDLLDGLANPSRWLTQKKLYQFQTGAAIYAPPTSYMIDGRQFVVMPSGTTLTAFALPR